MEQMDAIARLLEEDPHTEDVRRAGLHESKGLSRRSVLVAAGAGVGLIALTGGGVLVLQNQSGEKNLAARAVEPLRAGAEKNESRDGGEAAQGVVWEAESFHGTPVVAPGGTAAVIDADGHVRVFDRSGQRVISADVTPEAALVAGRLGKEDVIAWTTGRVMSWWTPSGGVKRVEHARPLGLTAVAGGVLVFDDEDWSGRLSGNEVVGLIAGNDALTIGVMPDGTSLAATVDGVITRWAPMRDMRLLQPTAPGDGLQVRRVAGLYSGHVVLVWEKPGDSDTEREAVITTMNVDDARTVATVKRKAVDVAQEKLVRSTHGAALAGVLIGTDGRLETVPDELEVVGSAGDFLAAKQNEQPIWLDAETGDVRSPGDGVTFQVSGASLRWVCREKHVTLEVVEEKQ